MIGPSCLPPTTCPRAARFNSWKAASGSECLGRGFYEAECCWKQSVTTDPNKASALARVFSHIGFCHQLPREMLACMLQSEFDPNDALCRRVAAKLFRGSSATKHCLEDVFAHLQSMTARATMNKKMSHFARYFYCTTARCVKTGGMAPIVPDESDWAPLTKNSSRESQELGRIFDMNTTNMPEPEDENSILFPKPKAAAEKKWKAAGPESHQRGAAAVAYLKADAETFWSHTDEVWAGAPFKSLSYATAVRHPCACAGCLLAKRFVYRLTPTDCYYLSFGFCGYAALGLRLTKKTDDETATEMTWPSGLCAAICVWLAFLSISFSAFAWFWFGLNN